MASHAPTLDVALIEWPDGPEAGGPRLLGFVRDADLVEAVRERLAAARRRDLARLAAPVRLVEPQDPEPAA